MAYVRAGVDDNDGTSTSEASLSLALRQEISTRVAEVVGAELSSLRERLSELESRHFPASTSPVAPTIQRHVSTESVHSVFSETGKVFGYSPMFPGSTVDTGILATANHDVSQQALPPCEDEEDAPESMFNYCMERLATSRQPWRNPALGYLILLSVVQWVLIFALSLSNTASSIAYHFLPLDERQIDPIDCRFASFGFAGTPAIHWCACFVSIFIIHLTIRSDYTQTLRAIFPRRDKRFGLWCLTHASWFWKGVFIPGLLSMESAQLFAQSHDPIQVVMNTLAVSFIMDVDDMMYCSLLNPQQKLRYQS